MSFQSIQLKTLLARKVDSSMHRHVFIFSGDEKWQRDTLKELLLTHENDALWLGDNAPENIPATSIKKAQNWLGREKQLVIFDANENFDVDSFAAISGIVVGGGLFILLMPPENTWNINYPSAFGQRLINSIHLSTTINIIKQNDKNIADISPAENINKKQDCDRPYLTFDQQLAVEAIETEMLDSMNNPVVLISDRGRGKSAALGIAAAKCIKAGIKKIAITAPRLRATDIVFKHIKQLLPEAEASQGKIMFNDCEVQFYAPDLIAHENIEADVLFVDEAAAIPVPLLTLFLNKFPQCVFSTTVHGYEGTGRGFSVRFNKVLNKEKPGWKKLQMKTPVRWADNDPLEQWMFDLLCLDAEIADKGTIGDIDTTELNVSIVEKKQLLDSDELLKEIFSLLVLAHYRTQPSDLQRLLDEKELALFIVKYNKHIVAIALVSHEGKFSKALSSAVYRGERRPGGHLLAQALTYHCGIENAATLNYSRIMRIAVHPEFQQQGIGTKLLKYIVNYEQQQGSDAIGTSFGLNLNLLNFWQAVKFNVVRIGFKREQTSGEHASIMLRPLSKQGEIVYQQASSRFIEQSPYWFEDVLSDLPEAIKHAFQSDNIQNKLLSDKDSEDLKSFVNNSRNYELCIAAINKLVFLEKETINNKSFPDELKQIINEKVFNKKGWKEIAVEMQLNGKESARKLLTSAITQLMEK